MSQHYCAGVQRFLEEATGNGAAIALITSTCSAPSEKLVDAALVALGRDIADSVRIFQCPQGGPPLKEVEATPSDDPLSFERSLQAATAHVSISFLSLSCWSVETPL